MRKVTPILLKKDIQIAYEESKFWMQSETDFIFERLRKEFKASAVERVFRYPEQVYIYLSVVCSIK